MTEAIQLKQESLNDPEVIGTILKTLKPLATIFSQYFSSRNDSSKHVVGSKAAEVEAKVKEVDRKFEIETELMELKIIKNLKAIVDNQR